MACWGVAGSVHKEAALTRAQLICSHLLHLIPWLQCPCSLQYQFPLQVSSHSYWPIVCDLHCTVQHPLPLTSPPPSSSSPFHPRPGATNSMQCNPSTGAHYTPLTKHYKIPDDLLMARATIPRPLPLVITCSRSLDTSGLC